MNGRKPRCRSGCITCRIRKIKCDETKPACLKCTSTGRNCDGYLPPNSMIVSSSSTKAKAIPPGCMRLVSPTVFPMSSRSELRALHFFRTRTTAALCSTFDSDYWATSILRLTAFDPMIRNSVIAFSSMHEGFELASRTKPSRDQVLNHRQLALQHYLIATKHMQRHLQEIQPESPTLLLAACTTSIFLELLRDNYKSAIKHLQGGLDLISAFCHNQCSKIDAGQTITLDLSATKPIVEIMAQALYLHDVSFDITLIARLIPKGLSTRFATISEAKEHYEIRSISAYRLLWAARKADSTIRTLTSLHQAEMKALSEWRKGFCELLTAIGLCPSTKDLIGIEIINIQYYCLEVMLNRALPNFPLQTTSASFIRILDLIQNLLQPPNHGPCLLPKFSFNIGVIGPLFYTSIQAPDLELRYRAARLLQHPNVPQREGMWASSMASLMSERIMSLQAELIRTKPETRKLDYNDSAIKSVMEIVRGPDELGITWFNLEELIDDNNELKVSVGFKDVGSDASKVLSQKEGVITWETW